MILRHPWDCCKRNNWKSRAQEIEKEISTTAMALTGKSRDNPTLSAHGYAVPTEEAEKCSRWPFGDVGYSLDKKQRDSALKNALQL